MCAARRSEILCGAKPVFTLIVTMRAGVKKWRGSHPTG